MPIKPVCKDCEKRNPGCHSICRDYISYKEKLDELNRKIKEEKTIFTAKWSDSKRKRICGR